MKYVAGLVLLVLSVILGVVASLNTYFFLATAGKPQFNAIDKPNLWEQGLLAVLAIVLFFGGIAVMVTPNKKT